MPIKSAEVADNERLTKLIVEDHWRVIIPVMQSGNIEGARQLIAAFDDRIETMAGRLPPEDATTLRKVIGAERERILAEYKANPAKLKRRLGVSLGVDAKHSQQRGDSLPGLAVKTAVRASVWEAIRALFRMR